MKANSRFVTKFASSIVAVLSCFDRVIFKGHLSFGDANYLNAYVDHALHMRRKDFYEMLRGKTEQLVAHAKAFAEKQGRPYHFFQGKPDKDALVQATIAKERLSQGLVLVLCCMENCRTLKLRYGKGRPWLAFTFRPQRVLYYYFLDPQFGLMYLRLQTWFPFGMQVYVNGHSWLARRMSKCGVGFHQQDNAFVRLVRPDRTQHLADQFQRLRWVRQLNGWARKVNPILGERWLAGKQYYWVIEQAEYATDVIFKSPAALNRLYDRLLDHAIVNLSAEDILTFLGRKLNGNFQGEVLTDCKKKRWPGVRIKHRMKQNWLKMYNKSGCVLRIETVINKSTEFRVRRKVTRKGRPCTAWTPMNKGVSNLFRYQQVAHAANRRYLDALSVVDDPTCGYQQVEQLVQSKEVRGRRYSGFNPARARDVQIFKAIMHGDHLVHGFYNADIRTKLHGASRDPHQRRKQANAVSRILKRLHVRGLVAKIPHTRRWRTTIKGQAMLARIIQLYYHGYATAA